MADEQKTPIPAGPWTVEDLGEELYEKLAREYCGFQPAWNNKPPLDLSGPYAEQEKALPSTPRPKTATNSNKETT